MVLPTFACFSLIDAAGRGYGWAGCADLRPGGRATIATTFQDLQLDHSWPHTKYLLVHVKGGPAEIR